MDDNVFRCVNWGNTCAFDTEYLTAEEIETKISELRKSAEESFMDENNPNIQGVEYAVVGYRSQRDEDDITYRFYIGMPYYYNKYDFEKLVYDSYKENPGVEYEFYYVKRHSATISPIKDFPLYVREYLSNSTYCYTQKYHPDPGYTIEVLAKTSKQRHGAFKQEIQQLLDWANRACPGCAKLVHFPEENDWIYKKRQAIITIYDPVMNYVSHFIKENTRLRPVSRL